MLAQEIPLPQIARDILMCKRPSIHKYIKMRPKVYYDDSRKEEVYEEEFDLMTGCKDLKEATNLVAQYYKKDINDISSDDVTFDFPQAVDYHAPRMFKWSKLPPQFLHLGTIAQVILSTNTSNIYKIKQKNNEFDIVVGARSREEAVNAVTSFEPLPFEDFEPIEDLRDDPFEQEKLTVVELIHERNKSRVSLWK